MFAMATVAPGNAAFVSSTMLPTIVPVVSCAAAGAVPMTSATRNKTKNLPDALIMSSGRRFTNLARLETRAPEAPGRRHCTAAAEYADRHGGLS
jgi:hypothetical protein